MSPDTLDQPTQLGNYDVLSKIAEGGMGTVYKARSRLTGEIVAVKVISPGPARNPVVLQRFEREFAAAKVLDHPNVVRAIEYCNNGPHPFLVMEFVDGESLGQRIERSGAVPEDESIRLIAQVCDGLQRAHKQGPRSPRCEARQHPCQPGWCGEACRHGVGEGRRQRS